MRCLQADIKTICNLFSFRDNMSLMLIKVGGARKEYFLR